jgi:hypothetical protein
VTLPHELNPLVLQNKEVLYDLFFQATSHALRVLALGYPRLKALLGFTAVLHTWNQDLLLHPHLHLVVTGGGLDPSGDRWVCSKNNSLLPVKALSQIIRGKFLDALQVAFHEGKLSFRGNTDGLKGETAFLRFLKRLRHQKWVLYSKEPFGGPHQVYTYVSRYTHRVAISNHRLLSCQNGQVTFNARDNNNPQKSRQVTLSALEFIRRFLLHVLPSGFVKIRHYGLLAPCNAKTKLEKARTLILQMDLPGGNQQTVAKRCGTWETVSQTWQELLYQLTGQDLRICPQCKIGTLVRRPLALYSVAEALLDSS